MKKIYSLLTFFLNIVLFTNCYAQNSTLTKDEQQSLLQSSGAGQNPATASSFQAFRNNPGPGNHIAGCDSLSTSYNSNNGLNGVMFDIVPLNNITITGMNINCTATAMYYVYYRNGGFTGFISSAGAWTLLDSVMVTTNGVDVPSYLGLTHTLAVNSGDSTGLYIYTNASTTKYTDGTVYGLILNSNSDLKILAGEGCTANFGNIHFGPRNFNGLILYCGATVSEEEISINEKLEIYPNPSAETSTLKFPKSWLKDNLTIRVTDLSGKMILEMPGIGKESVQLDNRSLAKGLYFFEVIGSSGLKGNGKFIKQ